MKSTRIFRKVQFAWLLLLIVCLTFANCRQVEETTVETQVTSITIEDEGMEYTQRDTLISHPEELHPVLVR